MSIKNLINILLLVHFLAEEYKYACANSHNIISAKEQTCALFYTISKNACMINMKRDSENLAKIIWVVL